jgi:plasmid stabilization system protein ParE
VRLEITPAALEDLQSIRAYTLETWGAEQEQAYLEGIWKRFGEIGANPLLFRFRNDLVPTSIVLRTALQAIDGSLLLQS